VPGTAVPKREFESVTPHRSDLLDPWPGYGVTQHIALRQVEQAAVAECTIASVKRQPMMILDRATQRGRWTLLLPEPVMCGLNIAITGARAACSIAGANFSAS
jgi:hypothetical protein